MLRPLKHLKHPFEKAEDFNGDNEANSRPCLVSRPSATLLRSATAHAEETKHGALMRGRIGGGKEYKPGGKSRKGFYDTFSRYEAWREGLGVFARCAVLCASRKPYRIEILSRRYSKAAARPCKPKSPPHDTATFRTPPVTGMIACRYFSRSAPNRTKQSSEYTLNGLQLEIRVPPDT